MRRFATGMYLVLHGLAHAGLGMTAQDVSRGMAGVLPAGWRVAFATILFLGAMPAFVAAGLGVWGVVGLRSIWRGLASTGVVASCLLITFYGADVGHRALGLTFNAIALGLCGALPTATAERRTA